MPKIVFQNFYLTIWSFLDDTKTKEHFDKMGFNDLFGVKFTEFDVSNKIERKRGTQNNDEMYVPSNVVLRQRPAAMCA